MQNKSICETMQHQLPFWEHLEDSQKQLLCNRAQIVEYQAGENIRGVATDCLGVLLVQSGKLRVYLMSDDGRDATVYFTRPGEVCVLAASCLLDAVDFDVLIDAETDSQAILIPLDVYSRISEQNLYVENYTYKQTTQRVSDVINAVQRILFLSLEQRLAAFLLEESERTHSDRVMLTQERIARSIGSAREAVSRSLKKMASTGSIELLRGGERLLHPDQLRAVL